jgi:hypothetical protein
MKLINGSRWVITLFPFTLIDGIIIINLHINNKTDSSETALNNYVFSSYLSAENKFELEGEVERYLLPLLGLYHTR